MDYKKMAWLARELANVSEDDFSDGRLLPFFNAVKDDLWSYLISAAKSNYNWDIWTISWSTVIWQSEYLIPEAASDVEWNVKISSIWLCYNWETYTDWKKQYRKARLVNIQSLKEDWNYYVNNQSEIDPIYFIADKSIFIAPVFKKEIEAWLQITWIKNIKDYTIDSLEEDIKIPSYLHKTLVQWVLSYIHKAEWRKDDASFEYNIYAKDRDQAAKKFWNRTIWPAYLKLPNNY